MAKQYRMIECRVCDRYKFTDDDIWYDKPIHSELFMQIISDMSKKDVCQSCLHKIKKESKVSKQQDERKE